jgi:hypothetical protein
MWPFKKRNVLPYQSSVTALLEASLGLDAQDCFQLGPVNLLEVSIATFWMLERVFHALPEEKHKKAGSYALDLFMDRMRTEYSPDELNSLVAPLLFKRLDEYSQSFSITEVRNARQALTNTALRIGQRVTGENELHIAVTMAIALQWYGTVMEAGKVLLQHEVNGELAW